jgi:hypothetical protein
LASIVPSNATVPSHDTVVKNNESVNIYLTHVDDSQLSSTCVELLDSPAHLNLNNNLLERNVPINKPMPKDMSSTAMLNETSQPTSTLNEFPFQPKLPFTPPQVRFKKVNCIPSSTVGEKVNTVFSIDTTTTNVHKLTTDGKPKKSNTMVMFHKFNLM